MRGWCVETFGVEGAPALACPGDAISTPAVENTQTRKRFTAPVPEHRVHADGRWMGKGPTRTRSSSGWYVSPFHPISASSGLTTPASSTVSAEAALCIAEALMRIVQHTQAMRIGMHTTQVILCRCRIHISPCEMQARGHAAMQVCANACAHTNMQTQACSRRQA
eukprot:359833-Chlamydomonas_euryale.AAC.12